MAEVHVVIEGGMFSEICRAMVLVLLVYRCDFSCPA